MSLHVVRKSCQNLVVKILLSNLSFYYKRQEAFQI